MEGLRTDPDGLGLAASYIGGSCDGRAQLGVSETATRIDLSITVKPTAGYASGACDSAGHLRTVAARLKAPVGSRSIWSDGRHQVPFDGARVLVVPTAELPSGLTGSVESGEFADETLQQGDAVTSVWHTRYLQASPAAPNNTCLPGHGYLEVRQGPAGEADRSFGWTPVSKADVGTAKAQLYREGRSRSPDAWVYTWTTDQGSMEVSNLVGCQGDQLFSPAELLRVARSLRPA